MNKQINWGHHAIKGSWGSEMSASGTFSKEMAPPIFLFSSILFLFLHWKFAFTRCAIVFLWYGFTVLWDSLVHMRSIESQHSSTAGVCPQFALLFWPSVCKPELAKLLSPLPSWFFDWLSQKEWAPTLHFCSLMSPLGLSPSRPLPSSYLPAAACRFVLYSNFHRVKLERRETDKTWAWKGRRRSRG